ncbi:lytic transglycosylase domain-containing protein [Salipiger abyssi]|uniref:lytic transglycosylase domain-containing protein n=1 Tax=Salipiger abyssi TaxID=1250539 RepID=UPI001F208D6F|nr:lytic transglycosylase domain-containing protein [Salipiger abyssi]
MVFPDSDRTGSVRFRRGSRRGARWLARLIYLFLTLGTICMFSLPVLAAPSAICDRAAREASRQTGVPVEVLMAIARTETGRARGGKTRPWPWTINVQGEGRWFGTRHAARQHAAATLEKRIRSFDLGCFQINYRWHGTAFRSLDEMLDPVANALYAARFLRRLHAETGSWIEAAGAYHSRTPKYAERYKRRYRAMRAGLSPGFTEDKEPVRHAARVNRFPLLRREGVAARASLAPLSDGAAAFVPGLGG